jgi:hydrogenase nickel incorporation protein HypA/HybF
MHELSIAMSLVEIASEEAVRLGSPRVVAVHVRVGALSGVVPDALQFSWDLATADTAVAGARLQIEDVPVTIYCGRCCEERTLSSARRFRCPACGELALEIRGGRDLALTALEVDEDHAGADR